MNGLNPVLHRAQAVGVQFISRGGDLYLKGTLLGGKAFSPLDNGAGGVLCLQGKELCSLTETGKFAFLCVEYHHMRTEHSSKPTVWAALRGNAAQCCPFCLSAKENML